MSEGEAGAGQLVTEGELLPAARLLVERGEFARASALFEQACSFDEAAEAAQRAGMTEDALRLAVLAKNDALIGEAMDALLASGDRVGITAAAGNLSRRGQHRYAATLYRRNGQPAEAAEAFECAAEPLEAALAFEAATMPADAARVLEAALRASNRGGAEDRLRLALGGLYERHGKYEAAVRALQGIALDSVQRKTAVVGLARCMKELGLEHAVAGLATELGRQGLSADRLPALDQSEEDPLARGKLYGRYQIIAEVAQTPHARLLEAVDGLTGERVAIKSFASRLSGVGRDALDRFVREARALSQLRHSNVVPLRAYVDQGPAMVLAWMAGGSLRDMIDREAISPARAAEIAIAVLSALAEAHRMGILHRDIKPANILFDEGGTAYLADFGAAHLSEADVTAGEIGTLAYMAPEQREGKAATTATDIYAVGVLLFEMIVGVLPGAEPSLSQTHPDLDETHDALLARMLAEQASVRWSSARAVAKELGRLSWSRRAGVRAPRAENPVEDTPSNDGGETEARWGPSLVDTDAATSPYRRYDRWLNREVLRLAFDAVTLQRSSAFARAGHPALPLVFGVSSEGNWIHVEPPLGTPLLDEPLTLAEKSRLRAALYALHQVGVAHGAVDGDHIYRYQGQVYWAFPLAPWPEAEARTDLAALDRFASRES